MKLKRNAPKRSALAASRWRRVAASLSAGAAIAVFSMPVAIAETGDLPDFQPEEESVTAQQLQDGTDLSEPKASEEEPSSLDSGSQSEGQDSRPAPPEDPDNDAPVGGGEGTVDEEEDEDEGSDLVTFAVLDAPYLKWEIKDTDGNLVGGATIGVQGPRTAFGSGYGNAPIFTVTDCVEEPCDVPGGDADPTPGVIIIHQLGSASNDQPVDPTKRYRSRQHAAPAGYKFNVTGQPWREIPGNGAVPSPGAWQNQTYTFPVITLERLMPVCEPNNVYAIGSNGQIQHVAPDGTVTDLGSRPTGTTQEFNGLGIGMNGTKVYAYSRPSSANSASVWEYDVTTGTWASKNASTGTQSVTFVAGAVSYDGLYYMGGYNSDGTEFHIWQYNPSGGAITKKGWINTADGAGGQNNGDMAFDSAGNLYVVRGTGTTTTIFSATYADFTAAAGAQITAFTARSQSNTVNNVNGVAFDSNARIYLGQASSVTWYQLPDWTPTASFTTGLSNSTDLSSCDTPPSVTVQKEVLGRVASTDQFRLQLKQGTTGGWTASNLLANVVTTGTATGLQDEKAGPQITPRGTTYSFRELFEGTGNTSSNYVSSWLCQAYDNAGSNIDPDPHFLGSGNGTSGTVTIPDPGPLSAKKQIICTISNSPLVAHVNITKNLLDEDGANPTPEPGWPVGMQASAVSGTVNAAPAATSQNTNSSGVAHWVLNFNTAQASANVAVSETQQTGYLFVSASCVVTDINGVKGSPIVLSSASGGTIPGVKPGETVDCAFNNQELERTLQLIKVVDDQFGGDKQPGDFPLAVTPTSPAGPAMTFQHTVARQISPGDYTISETQQPGYELLGISCVKDGGAPVELVEGALTIGLADEETVCTLTNRTLPGEVQWSKVAALSSDLLEGSEWKLVGPEGSSSQVVTITDCVADDATDCTGPDKDPAGGMFHLQDLMWGTYSLVETKAPAGYVLDETPREIVISGSALSVDVGALTNQQHDGPAMPITGGLGSDAFLIAGGISALLGGAVTASLYLRRSARRSQ